jgi:hypothetical protein
VKGDPDITMAAGEHMTDICSSQHGVICLRHIDMWMSSVGSALHQPYNIGRGMSVSVVGLFGRPGVSTFRIRKKESCREKGITRLLKMFVVYKYSTVLNVIGQ